MCEIKKPLVFLFRIKFAFKYICCYDKNMADEASGEYTLTEMKKMKPGSYILIEGDVYKVDKMTTSKPGKHGACKAKVSARAVFITAKKMIVKPADAKVKIPVILKKQAQVVAVMGDMVQLMDLETYETFDVDIPEEFKGKLDSGAEVTTWRYGKDVMIVGKK